ncbi:MAG: Bug family tripartite tricarboxylate transporter substrate binding protein [Xanthobacteraceae bacterium]
MRQIILACALALAAPAAHAEPADFAGKTITIISSFGAGGGYTTYAEIVARHLGAHLPGRPTVIVKTMPGAGGMNGTSYLANVAARDGTVLGVVPQTVAIAQALGRHAGRYDARAFNWIGRVNSNVEVQQTWHTAPVKTIEDARLKEVVVGGTGPQSSSVVFPRILNAMFGMKFKVVAGYEGVNMVSIAMERGEVQGMVRPWSITKTVHPEWLREKKINLLVQYAAARHPEIPQVPAVVDLAATDEQRQILSLFASGSDIGRSIMAPPGVPADAVKALRTAFMQTMRDPALLKEIRKSGIDIDPLAGGKLQEIVRGAVDVPPKVTEAAKAFTAKRK